MFEVEDGALWRVRGPSWRVSWALKEAVSMLSYGVSMKRRGGRRFRVTLREELGLVQP